MGRKPTKENKNQFFLTREECGWTREQAIEHIPGISLQRLERIENQGFIPAPPTKPFRTHHSAYGDHLSVIPQQNRPSVRPADSSS